MENNRFTQRSMQALQSAQQLALSYGNAQVEPVHLLHALITEDNSLIAQLLGKLEANAEVFCS